MQLHFAPLQGYTTAIYRKLHHATWGGVAQYYTPFVRIEKGGFRNKDIADIAPHNNTDTPVIPQMLPRDAQELQQITLLFLENGYTHADINMGCPFPPVALHKRGSGILPYKEMVEQLLQATTRYPEMQYSVKMRLGWENRNEWKELIDILNATRLTHITLHPRIGRQQYKGNVDMEAFEEFAQHCNHPIIYNGDVNSIADIQKLQALYPQLSGIMMGRGLLARPYLSTLLTGDLKPSNAEIIEQTFAFHNALFETLQATSQGETQLLQRAHALWEYFLPHAPRKERKAVVKSHSATQYQQAVEKLFTSWLSQHMGDEIF